MPQMIKKLAPSEIKYGYIYHSELCDRFPKPSQPVTIIDSDGEKFKSKMHSSQSRIDRLTKLYQKHESQSGQTVIIEVNPNEVATAHFIFEDNATENIKPTLKRLANSNQTAEQQVLEERIPLGAGFGNPETNRRVERAAIKFVTNWYRACGWDVHSVEADKCGYDLHCRKGAVKKYIEVKGIQGELLSFSITAGEVRQAQNNQYLTTICVVTSVLSKTPKLYRYTGTKFIKDFYLAPLVYRASLRK